MPEIVSIIVPVYNADKFLDKCINSITEQTYQDFELLLVDDGSKDQSSAICLAWMDKDPRVKFYHQKNAGVSAARNRALMNAVGQYVTFVDADDYLEPNFCEKMIDVIQQSGADIVFCEHRQIFEDGRIHISGSDNGSVETISEKEFEYYGLKGRRAVWGALYKRNILRGMRFPDGIAIGEDALFLAKAIRKAENISYYGKPLYNYLIQNESAYYGSFSMNKFTEIDAWLLISKVFEPGSITQLSADALCADTSMTMLGRYAGDAGFESKYINRLIHVYRSKLPRLIQYDHKKKRRTFKHILYGLFPHVFVKYWGWKNEKKHRHSNIV